MDFFTIIITTIAILIFVSMCSACYKGYQRKQVYVRQTADRTGSIYVTEATVIPAQYPSNTPYLSMPQPTSHIPTSQPLHPAGLGWQVPPYVQTDSPPSYEEVIARPAATATATTTTTTTTHQQLPEPHPKQTKGGNHDIPQE